VIDGEKSENSQYKKSNELPGNDEGGVTETNVLVGIGTCIRVAIQLFIRTLQGMMDFRSVLMGRPVVVEELRYRADLLQHKTQWMESALLGLMFQEE